MVLNQQTFHSLNIGYSAAFQKGFDEVPTQYDKVATIVPSTTKEQTYGWIGNLPSMKKWIGEREIQNLSASTYSIINDSFEMTVGVDRDDIEDDTYGTYSSYITDMGQCAKRHPNELVFGALANGFEKKCYDDKPFFATNHALGKTVYSNKGTKKLTKVSYQEARTAMMSLKNEKDVPLGLIPNMLVVAPSNESEALLILKADQIEGTTNVYKDTAEILMVPELAATPDAWFLLCTTRALKPIIYQIRKEIVFTNLTNATDSNVFMQKQYLYGAEGRSNVGYGYPQMAWGSDGTTAG